MLLVDSCIQLDAHASFRDGNHGRVRFPGGFQVHYDIAEDGTLVHLTWDGNVVRQTIRLVTLPLPNGGWKRYFIANGHRVRRIYGAPGALAFTSRQALADPKSLRYQSQLGPYPKRYRHRVEKIRKRFGYDIRACRPAGLRTRAWDRLRSRLDQLDPLRTG